MLKRAAFGLLGAFVAIVSGWLSGIVVAFLFAAVAMVAHPHQVSLGALLVAPWIVAIGSLYFILPVSLALVPLYLLIPRSWLLWRWPVCTTLGLVSGVCIVAVFLSQPNRNPPESVFSWYVLAAAIGGTTCLIASITHEQFLPSRDRI
jgi:hypothetical protein